MKRGVFTSHKKIIIIKLIFHCLCKNGAGEDCNVVDELYNSGSSNYRKLKAATNSLCPSSTGCNLALKTFLFSYQHINHKVMTNEHTHQQHSGINPELNN